MESEGLRRIDSAPICKAKHKRLKSLVAPLLSYKPPPRILLTTLAYVCKLQSALQHAGRPELNPQGYRRAGL